MGVEIYHGDSREVLRLIPENSIDACCTDPPYALVSISKRFGQTSADDKTQTSERIRNRADGYARAAAGFMGQKWDTGDVAFDPDFWLEVYRTLKPGAHLCAFGGDRSYHRLACAIEDAGFEIRHTMVWSYSTGFPKSHDVSKAIDKAAGSEREIINRIIAKVGFDTNHQGGGGWAAGEITVTAPATPEAKQWEGWGTALKPAVELICVARKPLSEKTVAANVLKWGTGALNIDACRIETGQSRDLRGQHSKRLSEACTSHNMGSGFSLGKTDLGRWPANLLWDGSDEVKAMFPNSAGQQGDIIGTEPSRTGSNGIYGHYERVPHLRRDEEVATQSASRFFWHPKAGKEDRWGSKHPCLLPGELVLTDRGHEPIENVGMGRFVYSDDGQFHKVVDAFASPCAGPIYRIGVQGTNLQTQATGNHPFLVWRSQKRNWRFGDTIARGAAEWINAEELVVGDYLLTPVSTAATSEDAHSVDWWFAAGLWLAEGTVLTNGHGSSAFPQYTLSTKEDYLVERLQREFNRVAVYPREKSNAMNVVVFASGVVEQFVEICGKGAKNKFISPRILGLDAEKRRAFLEGYIAGDGCTVRGAYRAKTASLALASTLPLLAESLGLRVSVYRYDNSGRLAMINNRPIRCGVYYSLLFSREHGGELFSRPQHQNFRTQFIEINGQHFSLRRVKSIAVHPYDGSVWNLTVEDTHTFQTAIGMSHNTVKPVELIKYLIRLICPPNGTVLDPFAGSGTTGVAAIAESKNAALIEREDQFFADIQERIAFYQGGDKHSLASKKRHVPASEASGSQLPLFAET